MRAWVAFGVLAWAALWPLGHRALVAVWDVNPWKLGGLAMYTTATPPVLVVAFAREGSRLVPLDTDALSGDARAEMRAFRIRRHALGALAPPDALADAILRDRPDLQWLVVMVQRMKLDPESARMDSTRDRYVYERSDEKRRR